MTWEQVEEVCACAACGYVLQADQGLRVKRIVFQAISHVFDPAAGQHYRRGETE